jgi:hypothetical protein
MKVICRYTHDRALEQDAPEGARFGLFTRFQNSSSHFLGSHSMTNSECTHTRFSSLTWRAVARLKMLCGVLLIGLGSASADVSIPDTPAGRAVSAWLTAFNSGDRARLDDYFKEYEPSKHADDFMGFRDRVGGFDLLSIEKSEPSRIVFLLKDGTANGGRWPSFK